MAAGDLAIIALQVCGGVIWAMFLGIGVGAAVLAIRHRRTHERLGLPHGGWHSTCPMCIAERERDSVPWYWQHSRDAMRKRLKRQEFDESGRR